MIWGEVFELAPNTVGADAEAGGVELLLTNVAAVVGGDGGGEAQDGEGYCLELVTGEGCFTSVVEVEGEAVVES